MRKIMGKKSGFFAALAVLGLLIMLGACAREEAASASAAGEASEWKPTRPITIITHVGSGGGTDVAVRLMTDIAREFTDATFVVENVTGGATMNASNAVLARPADGYTVFAMAMSNVNNVVSNDFDRSVYIDGYHWLAKIQKDPAAVIIRKSDRDAGMDFEGIIKQAREKRGNQIWAVPVLGANKHFEALMIWEATGVEATAVPFVSGPLGAAAVLGGSADVQMGNPFNAKGRDLWVAAIASPERMPGFEDSPTFAELGYPELNNEHIWRGLAVRQGTPPAMIEWMEDLVTKIYDHPRWKEFNAENAIAPRAVFGDDFRAIVDRTVEVTEYWLGQLDL
ncbi:Tripartite-type tricarboxylate transporter, receptor component TctC [Alkalispirochaeta americana]|uniref:Tripartite-type tricarboxylate transporter, receptor component TctC n=1 Tax=Alkalispirochaeta americana TaxID=159291 RepID=A0A1N6UBK7_9SPIO|nr:tripartite tricarboxylate transporter substrate binding protein [Alkalispirochaeta americana]SIQ62959.1 Tripartite-type tricarboxylate transporter, receptor component TctC [Alkalispirochaeta americana]